MEAELNSKSEKPRLLGIIWSPGEQLDRIRQTPKIWVPLLLVSLLFAVGMSLMAFTMDAEYLGLGQLSEAEQSMVLVFAQITLAITGIVTPVFTVLISSAIYMLIAKIAGSDVKFKQLFSMNTYILVIGSIGLILNVLIRMMIGGNPEIFITSLDGLLNSAKPGVGGSIELFAIWQTILTAMGLQRVAHFSKGLAWTIAIIFFLIGIGFTLMSTALSGIAGV